MAESGGIGMFVVLVTWQIKQESCAAFRKAVVRQAATSLREETACHRFDVSTCDAQPDTFVLYEVYGEKADFDLHLKTDHYAAFSALSAPMTVSKTVQTLELINPD